MAPEQITGDTSISGKADLYSLGCCLFEMLLGRKPFNGDDPAQLFEQHLHSRPQHVREFVRDCPAELDDIIDKLLEKSPDDRPFNARQVQAAMLRLEETIVGKDAPGAESDVAADGVATRGRQLLRKQIQLRIDRTPPGEVGWRRLAVMVLAILAVIIVASFFGR
jgi:serine/threonine protein kinase